MKHDADVFRAGGGIAYWLCPQCGVKWHRWSAPGRIRDRLAVLAPDVIDVTEDTP